MRVPKVSVPGFLGSSPNKTETNLELEGGLPAAAAKFVAKMRAEGKNINANNRIGVYILDKTIGEGKFAKVKLAYHMLTGEKVAIKIVDKTAIDESTRVKVMREVQIMKTLDHPSIVKLYEVIDTSKALYLVLEYCSGGEIFDYIVAHGRLPEKEARKHFRDIISALQYCHSMRVVHRDLKAENLLLNGNMNIKIADFGFGNSVCNGQLMDTYCGSPPYAAPEIFMGKPYSGPEADVWSLGVMLFVLVCGSLPFDGENLNDLRSNVCSGRIRIPFFMSYECESLLKRMLVVDPRRRSTCAELLSDPWINLGYDKIQVPYEPVPENQISADIEHAVLEEMAKMGFEQSAVKKSLKKNAYDSNASTYFLMRDLMARDGRLRASPMAKHSKAKETETETDSIRTPRRRHQSMVVDVSHLARVRREQQILETGNSQTLPLTPAPVGMQTAISSSSGKAMDAILESPRSTAVVNQLERMHQRGLRPRRGDSQKEREGRSARVLRRGSDRSYDREAHRHSLGSDSPSRRISPLRRTSPDDMQTDDDDGQTRGGKSEDVPQEGRFAFNEMMTSARPADEIISEVAAILQRHSVSFEQSGHYAVTARYGAIVTEIEVCKLAGLSVNSLRLRRVSGDIFSYKSFCEALIAQLKL
eukprot:Clim_evm45s235 gene=Clim_evmTU45s235